MKLPAEYKALVSAFDSLPGIGERAAGRMARWALNRAGGDELVQALQSALLRIRPCERCQIYLTDDHCSVCDDLARGQECLAVVAELEQAQILCDMGFSGQLFVLHGVLSPVASIGPAQLPLAALQQRVNSMQPNIVYLLLAGSVEGDVTAQYLQRFLLDTHTLMQSFSDFIAQPMIGGAK
ncbi:toprim domain-containing protein [Thalassolituus sp.]|uniref:toprim domain-containing protein n=1 Tax=Thalassolituus sp. TaxID=2030822 RepID=UPI001B4505BB|nr:toprim domain-containing protein [Thalassolituus sp.]MBQ0782256.1 toprim domain-containing protein [Thalassolituus oleivorans]